MKLVLLMFLLLQFASLAFAQQWLSTSAIAIVTSVGILALIYAIGIGLNSDDLKFLSSEELYQTLVTIVMISVVLGAENFLNAFSASLELGDNLQDASLGIMTSTIDKHSSLFNNLKTFSKDLGKEASEGMYCSWQGMGFNTAACSSFRSLAPATSLSMQTLSLSVAELGSVHTLLNFGKSYSFTLLLPLGILLRTFRFSRGAGGLFLGLAVSLYLFTPLSVIFMNILISSDPVGLAAVPPLPTPSCNVFAYANALGEFDYENVDTVNSLFADMKSTYLPRYLYAFLINGTLNTIVILLTFIASLRWVSKLAGADVDISALARLA
ncbi:hypothetical protein J4450_01780 [Candidatus Micrarchaeota archaeon]|nr:hypothetical protein [Candidatus Micrarchaeota archaeon]